MYNADVVIIGAGPVGCVLAHKISTELNLSCLIIEKRNHIAGNCFDSHDKNEQLIHKYGPHYFRTNNEKIINYLSKFTEWIEGNYVVKTSYENQLYSFPINLNTLEKFYNQKLSATSAKDLLKIKSIDHLIV